MKRSLLFTAVVLVICHAAIAQWQPVSIPGITKPVSYIVPAYSEDDGLLAGTWGDGLFYSDNQGASWTNITYNIGNKNINFIMGNPDDVVIAGTTGGLFALVQSNSYQSFTPGLANNDITAFGNFNEDDGIVIIGTNGGGVYTAPNAYPYSWTARNSGLSGDALIINSITNYEVSPDNYVTLLGTDNGIFKWNPGTSSWQNISGPLTGESLKVNHILPGEGSIIIATDFGVYLTSDFGQTWISDLTGIKIKQFDIDFITGTFFAFGEKNYFITENGTNWEPLIINGLPDGIVTSSAITFNGNIFVVVEPNDKSPANGGSLYFAPTALVVASGLQPAGAKTTQLSNFPNPANEHTRFRFNLTTPGNIALTIADISGKTAGTVVSGFYEAGEHQIDYSTAHLPAGIYLCTLNINNQVAVRTKMVVIK